MPPTTTWVCRGPRRTIIESSFDITEH
ncbi:rCG43066 [Rattus norvegicus]|uniref:RCG43066 n=1 Tax=Rattus norvegicus TaxID=10116 RepID=A6IWQ7_RAT|nr:rCG43066 [Rattus norvegicus]